MNRIEEWNENVDIGWWRDSRIQLNRVIRKYNKWIQQYTTDRVKTAKLLNKINNHLDKFYSNRDGGEAYKEELLRMKATVVDTIRIEQLKD